MADKPASSQEPRLLDQVRQRIRVKHYSIRTETAYVDWIKRFIPMQRQACRPSRGRRREMPKLCYPTAMPSPSRPSAWLLALVAMALLFAQVSGLHHHRHVELSGATHVHGSQLHFEDVGLHLNGHDAEHGHSLTHAGPAHPHLDIDTRVVDDGLAKLSLDLGVLLALPVLLAFCLPRLGKQVPRLVRLRPPRRRARYFVRPPSHAPPLTRFVAF